MINVKYEFCNGNHMLEVMCDQTIRNIYFPNNSLAIDFMHRIEEYAKLKTFDELKCDKERAA